MRPEAFAKPQSDPLLVSELSRSTSTEAAREGENATHSFESGQKLTTPAPTESRAGAMKITGAIYRGRTSKPVFSRRGFAVDQEKRDAVVLEALGRSGQIAAIAART